MRAFGQKITGQPVTPGIRGKKKAFAVWVNCEGILVPGTEAKWLSQIAPVRRYKLCREAAVGVIDPETTSNCRNAPTQEGGQLCFPAKA